LRCLTQKKLHVFDFSARFPSLSLVFSVSICSISPPAQPLDVPIFVHQLSLAAFRGTGSRMKSKGERMKGILAWIWVMMCCFASIMMLGGCAMQTQVNQQIADSNVMRFKAYTEGMVGCGRDESCKLGLSMAYASNMGVQPFFRESDGVDYMKAGVPYFSFLAELTRLFVITGGESQGMVITGDNNTLVGVGNKLYADNQSSVAFPLIATIDNHRDNYVQRDSRSSSIGTGTVSDVENPVDDHSVANP